MSTVDPVSQPHPTIHRASTPFMRLLTQITIFGMRLAPLLLIVYWILIFTGTHLPGSAMRYAPRLSDKLMHFSAFAGLSFLLAWALPRRVAGRSGLVWTAAISLAYGLFDEWTQGFVWQRTPDWQDLVADACGVVVGISVYLAMRKILFFRKSPQRSAA